MLRRVEYGDYDLIITFFTSDRGKLSAIANSAKKSKKRFVGILELFSVLDIVISHSRRNGLAVLAEAELSQPFDKIRNDIVKTAYASYWAELINKWLEEKDKQTSLYKLLYYVLHQLDQNAMPKEYLSILFQIRFVKSAGLRPNLGECYICGLELDKIADSIINFDIKRGGIICNNCRQGSTKQFSFSKGTIKQLLWIERGNIQKASRIRFTKQALKEGLKFLETFVPYHMENELKSLNFLKQIR